MQGRFISKNRIQLAILTLSHLVVDFYGGFLFPLIPVLVKRLDVKLSSMAVLAGTCGIVVNAIQPVAGLVSPRWKLPVLMLSGVVMAGLAATLGFTSNFWLVGLIFVLANIGIGIFHPEALLVAHELSGEKDHVGIPIFMSSGYFGWSMGMMISAQWVAEWGFGSFWMLGIPAVVAVGLLVFGGLFNVDIKARSAATPAAGQVSSQNFWLLLVLAISLVTPICVLSMFMTTDLTERFGGKVGLEWGGYALAAIGICGTVASLGWGWLSARVSPFIIIAVGQLVCMPMYYLMLNAEAFGSLILLSAIVGLLMGGTFFPLIATAARRCRSLSPSLRAGIIVGGSWGGGSVISMVLGKLTDYGVTVERLLIWVEAAMALTAALALWAYYQARKSQRRNA